jgi:hypothetical protein
MSGDQIFGLATGTITFTDSGNGQEVPINSQGVAGYSPSSLSVGTHAITLSYSGDASYQPSTAGPFTFTITQGNPMILIPYVEPSVPAGGNLLVEIVLGTGFGTPPTGNVSVTLGSVTVTAALFPASWARSPFAIATATFANLQTVGSFTLSVNYAGDSNWKSASASYPNPIVVAPAAGLPSSTTLAVAPASITRLQSTQFTATVQGASATGPAPTGSVVFYVNGQALPGTLAPTGLATSVASPSAPVPALTMSNGSNQVVAVYSGDGVYNPSTSAPATVNVNLNTFSLLLGTPRVAIPSGQSGSAPLILNALDGFSMPLSLSCSASSGSIGCTVSPAVLTVSGTTTTTLTINAYTLSANTSLTPPMRHWPWLPGGMVAVFALVILLALHGVPRHTMVRWRWVMGYCVFSSLLLIAGCGGGSTIIPPPQQIKIPAPAGTYSVLVSATANGTIYNAKLIVVVQ